MKKIYLVFLILIIAVANSQAQSAQKIFKTMLQKIEDGKGFSTQADIIITDSTNQPVASYQAQVKKHDNNFYYKLSNNEIIMNDSLHVTINHAEKIVQVNPRSTAKDPDFMQMISNMALEQLAGARVNDTGAHWLITLQDAGELLDFAYRIDKNFQLEQVSYHTVQGLQVKIQYSDFSYNPANNPADFAVVHIINGRGKLVNDFKMYQLIDNVYVN